MKLVVKVHQKDDRTVVAVCDAELLGSVYEENGVQLDLTKDFYKGDLYESAQEVGDIIRNADCVNLVGENAIRLALNEAVVEPAHIKRVEGVPHVQIVIIQDHL